jgi:hypothetical protein
MGLFSIEFRRTTNYISCTCDIEIISFYNVGKNQWHRCIPPFRIIVKWIINTIRFKKWMYINLNISKGEQSFLKGSMHITHKPFKCHVSSGIQRKENKFVKA